MMHAPRDYDSPVKRMQQLQRVLTLITLIYPLRYGATIEELHRDICTEYGEMCERTIRRDLRALSEMGFVDIRRDYGRPRWVWQQSHRARLVQETAEHWLLKSIDLTSKPPETFKMLA